MRARPYFFVRLRNRKQRSLSDWALMYDCLLMLCPQVNKLEHKLDQALHMLNVLVHRPRTVRLTLREPTDSDY